MSADRKVLCKAVIAATKVFNPGTTRQLGLMTTLRCYTTPDGYVLSDFCKVVRERYQDIIKHGEN